MNINSQPFDYPTANLSTSWLNIDNTHHSVNSGDNSSFRFILVRGIFGWVYASGFYCTGSCDTYLFSIVVVHIDSNGAMLPPQVVWSANRDNPVRTNATLQLTAEGELALKDADGTLAWSTNTVGRLVAGLNLTDMGNLVLFNANNSVVWLSFDHPTDCLLPGQMLALSKNLTASASSTNEGGLYSLSITGVSLAASIHSEAELVYYETTYAVDEQSEEASYAMFQNGSLYINGVEPLYPDLSISGATSDQYMKLGADGHLRVFQWANEWEVAADIFTGYIGECGYPMACGMYGICSNGQCSCPVGARFR